MFSLTARSSIASTRPSVGRANTVQPVSATKIYVGNLSWGAQKEDLAELFGKYGTIEDLFIPMDRETGRPRGFAFVTLSEDAGAQTAISELNETDFMDRALRVNEAMPQENRPPSAYGRGGGRGYGGGRGGGRGDGGGRGGGGRGYGRGRRDDDGGY